LGGLLNTVLNLLIAAIVARAILSFLVPLSGTSPHPMLVGINSFVSQITEPMLGPLRRVLPTVGVMDFSPMVAIIILVVIKEVVRGRI
jgi:YggT family protein